MISLGETARLVHKFHCGDVAIDILILPMRRRTMAIHVFADQLVELRIPQQCGPKDWEPFLNERRAWIHDSIVALGGVRTPDFTEGERHDWLGRSYRLHLSEGRRHVGVTGDLLAIRCPSPDDAACVRDTFERHCRTEAKRTLPERLQRCRELFRDSLPSSTLKIRKMKSRWGSCSDTGEICLNSLLMQKSMAAIDFVIVHELCHLRHFSHNRSFYRLMDRTMPDWREREKLLTADDGRLQFDLF